MTPLRAVLQALPRDLPAAVFVVMHVGPRSELASLLGKSCAMVVRNPRANEPIAPGHIYVAPPNRHMRIQDGHVLLDHGPLENRHRPAIDPLFRSAARAYRSRVIGIILSGALDDGVAGLFAVKERGGIAIVQDPDEAQVTSMPQQALLAVEVDHRLPAARIGPLVCKLVNGRSGRRRRISSPGPATESQASDPVRQKLSISCPECNGPLFETHDNGVVRIECEIGHTFSPQSFTEAHTEALERALWTSIRTLRERADLHRRIADHRDAEGTPGKSFLDTAKQAEADIELLREILERL